MFDPETDSYAGLLERATQARWNERMKRTPLSPIDTMLPDPRWDAYMQAVKESNPGKSLHFGGGGGLPDDDGQPGTPPLALQGLMGALKGKINYPKPLEVQA